MIWIAPSEKDTDNAALEKRLWDAAVQFRANASLKSQEYSAPVLGRIFLRFAGNITQQHAHFFQFQDLRRTRDLLLPHLLSGQTHNLVCPTE
jgi:hypothetical protein